MAAVWMRARAQGRRRWCALLVLAVLVAVFGGAVLASLAGARRTSTSFDRLMAHLDTADVNIGQDSELRPEVLEQLSALPSVDVAGQAAFLLIAPAGIDQFGVNAVAPTDEHWLRTIDRPLVLEGRMPEAVDEVAMTEGLAARAGKGVGDRVEFTSFAPEQIHELFTGEAFEPKGPRFSATLVGIALHPQHLSVGSVGANDTLFSHAFYREHGDDVLHFGPSLMVKLRGGIEALSTFRREVRALEARIDGPVHVGIGSIDEDNDIRVISNHDLYRPASEAVRVQGIALWLFGGLLAVTVALILGQALAREAMRLEEDASALGALGMGRPQQIIAATAPVAIAVLIGVVVAVGIAFAASGLFPSSFARDAEPTPGLQFDGLMLGAGAVVLLIVLVVVAALGAHRATSRRRQMRSRPASIVTVVSRAGVSTSGAVGVRMALEPGRGRTAVPVRATFVGAIAGIAALVAALGVGASLDRFIATPSAYGINWDAAVSGGDDPETMPRTIQRLRAMDGVDEMSAFILADVRVQGAVLQAYVVDRIEGDVTPTIAAGRAPSGPGEIALGAATMRRLDVGIGESVEVRGRAGDELIVVGHAVFPAIDEDLLDDAAVLDASVMQTLRPIIDYPVFPVRFAPGVSREAMLEALTDEFGGTDTFGIDQPGEVQNLARITNVPRLLAGLLVVIALATIAHVLVTTVRRRARDIAVLKTLGLQRRQVMGAIRAQSATFAIVAGLIGIPVGVIAGRWAWMRIAHGLGVGASPDPALLLVAVVLPLALIAVSMAVGSVPARAAARTKPALVLRSE